MSYDLLHHGRIAQKYHALGAHLQKKHECPVVYLTGTVGGLMTSLHVEVKDEQGNPLADGTFAKTERYGQLVGQLADRALAGAKPVKPLLLISRSEAPCDWPTVKRLSTDEAAMPLMWAHAEYLKLLRSASDAKVYDLIPAVARRYLGKRAERKRSAPRRFAKRCSRTRRSAACAPRASAFRFSVSRTRKRARALRAL